MFNYRCGVIGLGRIGAEFHDNHVKAYQDSLQCDLVAVSDVDGSKALLVPDVPLYTNYMDMVKNSDMGIVSVCTPPETHRKIVCDIAPYVLAIYCEKPIATTLSDADAMIEECHKFGTILQINHQRRFVCPKFTFSRGMLNTGTHAFDLIRQLFGEVVHMSKDYVLTSRGMVGLEYKDTMEPFFQLDCTRSTEPMIKLGVEHLVDCIINGVQSYSSGEEARESLKCALEYGRIIEKL